VERPLSPKWDSIPPEWREIIAAIPGYDPVATSGDCVFDAQAAGYAISWVETYCKHVKGALAGKPIKLELWEKAILANLFGWKRPDGTRRYREAFVFVARKNGKTTLLAAIVLLVLFTDEEPGAEIYSAAADREQACLVYDQAKGMVFQCPEMESRVKVYATSKTIWDAQTNSSYKAISADANTKHGYNTHLAVIDELHAQPDRDLVDVLMTSTGSRTQPLILHITTSDFERPSICNEKHAYAGKVRDGLIEDLSFLPVIYEATIEDDWTSPATWAKANPNLGVSVSREYLERECARAQESPAYENTFKRLHLNIRTEQDVRWLQMAKWDACGGPMPNLAGKLCYAGFDLASTADITAFVLYFPEEHAVLPWFWIPEDTALIREKRDRVPYLTWAKAGYLKLTPGNACDYETVLRCVTQEIAPKYSVQQVGGDPWNATQFMNALTAAGFNVVQFRQGFASLNEPTKQLEKDVLTGVLNHGGNPVLRWMASNVTVETDAAGNLKPSKKKSTEKIDGIVAMIIARGCAMIAEQTGPSVYSKRGLVYV